VRDIDGQRSTFKIRQGKGNKDRFVVIPPSFIQQLRRYWCHDHPRDWFFPISIGGNYPIGDSSLRKKMKATLQMAGIDKRCSPHRFRQAYAPINYKQGYHYINYSINWVITMCARHPDICIGCPNSLTKDDTC
jgi:integrase